MSSRLIVVHASSTEAVDLLPGVRKIGKVQAETRMRADSRAIAYTFRSE
jgi:hypothetical protein